MQNLAFPMLWLMVYAFNCVDLLQVIVKDFVSRAVIAHFRAHTSPISALCFDPSGTLLVTASIHGNNINIFRIMPSCSKNGAGSQNYNWTSSHVHLYKLHRGITSAVCSEFAFFLYYSFFLSKLFSPPSWYTISGALQF